MKNLRNKTMLLFLGLCSLGLLYSFNKKKSVKTKKYEVIRTIDGNVTIYDTILRENSDFTPNDYLSLLGFEKDDNIKIIDFDGESAVYNFSDEQEDLDGHTKTNIKIIKLKDDNSEQIDINQEVKVIKRSESSSIGLEEINIDSIINSVISGISSDSIIIRKFIVSDSITIGNETSKNNIVKVMKYSNIDEQESTNLDKSDNLIPSLTLLIVSDGDESTEPAKKNLVLNDSNFDVAIFPNPAANKVKVNFESSQKAETIIRIVDLDGKVIYEANLGEIVGSYSEEIDLEKFAKGTYIINVQNGKDRTNQKLVIE